MLDSSSVVLVTTTFYRNTDDVRFRLALKTIDAAIAAGYPMVIVDGSLDEAIRGAFHKRAATVLVETRAREGEMQMGASRRQAFRAGFDTGADVIVWLEPEKAPIVPLLGPSIEMVVSGGYDIVVPARESLESYPMYQELSELRANRELGFITGRPDLDLMIGPRVMNRRAAELFLSYTGQASGDNWEILFVPILWALHRGLQVGSRRVAYVHPSEQTAAEGGPEWKPKRDKQRHDLVTAMRREWAHDSRHTNAA